MYTGHVMDGGMDTEEKDGKSGCTGLQRYCWRLEE